MGAVFYLLCNFMNFIQIKIHFFDQKKRNQSGFVNDFCSFFPAHGSEKNRWVGLAVNELHHHQLFDHVRYSRFAQIKKLTEGSNR